MSSTTSSTASSPTSDQNPLRRFSSTANTRNRTTIDIPSDDEVDVVPCKHNYILYWGCAHAQKVCIHGTSCKPTPTTDPIAFVPPISLFPSHTNTSSSTSILSPRRTAPLGPVQNLIDPDYTQHNPREHHNDHCEFFKTQISYDTRMCEYCDPNRIIREEDGEMSEQDVDEGKGVAVLSNSDAWFIRGNWEKIKARPRWQMSMFWT